MNTRLRRARVSRLGDIFADMARNPETRRDVQYACLLAQFLDLEEVIERNARWSPQHRRATELQERLLVLARRFAARFAFEEPESVLDELRGGPDEGARIH